MPRYSNRTTISSDQRVELTIPWDPQSRAWDDFESGIRSALESGKRAILLRAPVMVAAEGIGRIRRLISSSLRPTNTLGANNPTASSGAMRWLVVDDLVLAKQTGADGVIFTSRPAPSCYSRAREVLGSKSFIGRLIGQGEGEGDTADTCSAEPGSEEIDLFVTAAPGRSLDADAPS